MTASVPSSATTSFVLHIDATSLFDPFSLVQVGNDTEEGGVTKIEFGIGSLAGSAAVNLDNIKQKLKSTARKNFKDVINGVVNRVEVEADLRPMKL